MAGSDFESSEITQFKSTGLAGEWAGEEWEMIGAEDGWMRGIRTSFSETPVKDSRHASKERV